MKTIWKEYKYALIVFSVFCLIMFVIAILSHGTCDEGDSIMHYLFAKGALLHPLNFLNHWAKPFYVLVMCPFAQFGFMGAKLFNTFLACVSVWFTYLIAKEMKYKWALAIFPISLFFKTFIVVTFSGLTEPLNNALLSIAIYLAFTKRYFAAALVMSFLPFVRSEGVFLCATFSLYLLWMRQWKALPLLLLGHIIYSLAGFLHYHDFLWVFNKIPYSLTDTHYGNGKWTYYLGQMPTIAGPVNTFLLLSGILATLWCFTSLLIQKKPTQVTVQAAFITIIFLVFFSMHTSFWALGIFGSFGLIRVFVAISCVMSLIMLSAIENIDLLLSKWIKWNVALVILTLSIIYPLFAFGNKNCNFRSWDFSLHPDQIIDNQMAAFVKEKYPSYKQYNLFFDASYLAEVLDVDYFDEKQHTNNDHVTISKVYPDKSVVIWDDWYTAFEDGTNLETLKNNKSIKEIKTFKKANPWGDYRTIVLFTSKND